jgi:hypothetical protein
MPKLEQEKRKKKKKNLKHVPKNNNGVPNPKPPPI